MRKNYEIKRLIKDSGYNLKEFASDIDMPYTTLLTILNGDLNRVTVGNLSKICDKLNVTIDYLLGNSEYRNFEDELAQKQLHKKLSEVDCIQDKNKKIALANAICTVVENTNSITQDRFLDCFISIGKAIGKAAKQYCYGSDMLTDSVTFPGMENKDYRHAVLSQCMNYINSVDTLYGECVLIIKDTVDPLKEIPQTIITDCIDGEFIKNYNDELLKPKKEV